MARLRYNFLGGLIEDNPLSSVATSLNSSGFAALETVTSPDYVPITLDPDGLNGAPEVVYVTAHTAATTSATISRGREGTVARSHVRNVPWVHGLLVSDFPVTRQSVPVDGVTRASTTLGSFSSPWTVTVPVLPGQMVELAAQVALTCSADEIVYIAFRKDITFVYEQVHYTGAINSQVNVMTHIWTDGPAVSATDLTYEVCVASSAGGTVTLKNGAVLTDTAASSLQGKCLLTARAVWP